MANDRAKAFELAREMADKRGGNPSEYIKEAYEIIKNKDGTTKKVTRRVEVTKSGGKGKALASGTAKVGLALGKAAWKGLTSGASQVSEYKDDFNFMKAPKDKPSDLKGITKVFSAPDPIPEVPESIKKLFKFW